MADFDDKLSAILGDQNAMSQIMALAQSLSIPDRQERAPEEEGCETELSAQSAPCQEQDVQLLCALRPYLKHSRQKKLDRTLEVLQLLRLFKGSRE